MTTFERACLAIAAFLALVFLIAAFLALVFLIRGLVLSGRRARHQEELRAMSGRAGEDQ